VPGTGQREGIKPHNMKKKSLSKKREIWKEGSSSLSKERSIRGAEPSKRGKKLLEEKKRILQDSKQGKLGGWRFIIGGWVSIKVVVRIACTKKGMGQGVREEKKHSPDNKKDGKPSDEPCAKGGKEEGAVTVTVALKREGGVGGKEFVHAREAPPQRKSSGGQRHLVKANQKERKNNKSKKGSNRSGGPDLFWGGERSRYGERTREVVQRRQAAGD